MGNEAKKTFVQLLKYGVIGVSNTLITLVVFYVINTLMGLDYAVANTLGYILGLINSFVWNRTWVFRTGLVYWGAMLCGCNPEMQQVACAVTVVAIRLLAVRYNWRIPVIENK